MVEAGFAGEHQIKGKSELQKAYRLEAIRHGAARFDAALSRGLTAYVGRDRELETLERRLAETRSGIQVIDIAGEPGIGKSRLLHEFRQRIGKSGAFILRGFVRRESAGIVFDAVTVASALPASVQSLLTARVDRLASADRALLQAAAVIGRRFDPDLLAVATSASGDIDRSLAAMQALDLVHRESKTGDYIFKHALVRDAVYSSLLSTARSMLHLKIADEIERRSANRLPEVAETLAYHHASTARTDKAFLYLAMAAKKIYSLDERMPMPGRRWTCSN